ncbi:MAG: hypothetical protein J7499_00120 [Sphingopyxis sp.]|nr:hypothetical protein [Sphingopyxis sp.]
MTSYHRLLAIGLSIVVSGGARRDADGYWWITGRVDDVINVSGHRLSTAEIESALVLHAKVAEAAVVGRAKGQAVHAYAVLNASEVGSDALENELAKWVRREIGPIATPESVQIVPGLPKTRSGKILRRLLRKVAEGATGDLGNTSTLADPSILDILLVRWPTAP